MPISKLIVTLVGLAAIIWVLWYFLASPGPSPVSRLPSSGAP
jgi:uncharacterized membrane protein (DUF106 family)